jgi:predicted nucleic-acid-binding protein
MISIDTNILVRVFVDDESDRTQIDQARRVVARYSLIYISQIVQAELIWVLKRNYGFAKEQILTALEHLRDNHAFVLENENHFEQALALYRASNADFSDTLIVVNSRAQGYPLLTFDKKLLKLDGVQKVTDALSAAT